MGERWGVEQAAAHLAVGPEQVARLFQVDGGTVAAADVADYVDRVYDGGDGGD